MERAVFRSLSLGQVAQTCGIHSGSSFYSFLKSVRTGVCLALKFFVYFFLQDDLEVRYESRS